MLVGEHNGASLAFDTYGPDFSYSFRDGIKIDTHLKCSKSNWLLKRNNSIVIGYDIKMSEQLYIIYLIIRLYISK